MADIHANLPALQAVLREMEQLGVRQALVLGDIVGYGPHPRECIATIRDRGFPVIKGNHDHAVAEGQFAKGFSAHARRVAEWTRERLDAEDLRWLAELPPYLQHHNWLAVHGAPQDRQFFSAYVYHMTYESDLDDLADRQIPICFHGHSHVAGVYFRKRGLDGLSKDRRQSLQEYSHCLVCPGSVGQPRDNSGAAACFALYQAHERQLTFYRIAYDVDATANDMLANDFPPILAHRLREGT